jgi:hypothetical protein
MATEHTADDFVEIYETDSPTEAERIVDVVLRPEGIEAVLHDRMSHAFPAPSSEPGNIAVAVPNEQREQAQQLLDEYLEGLQGTTPPDGS